MLSHSQGFGRVSVLSCGVAGTGPHSLTILMNKMDFRTLRKPSTQGLNLGSGLINQSQKMTVAAMAMADMKV